MDVPAVETIYDSTEDQTPSTLNSAADLVNCPINTDNLRSCITPSPTSCSISRK